MIDRLADGPYIILLSPAAPIAGRDMREIAILRTSVIVLF